jgi:hypothetical protein
MYKKIAIGPDLLLKKLTAPATATRGQVISFSDTTSNKGGGPTLGETRTRFFLSTDKKLKLPGDTELELDRPVPTLAAGASHAGVTNVTIPIDVAPGAYFLLGKADADEVEPESNEKNNVRAIAITVN